MTVGTPNSSKRLKRISYAKYGYLFSLPFILAYLIFSLYPTIYTAILGFTDCEGIGNTDWNILEGNVFANFKWVLQNELFKKTIKNTIVIWILNFIPQITMALILTAWFTSRRNELKGKGAFKVIFYMPNIITAASVAMLFFTLFQYPAGPVNDLLTRFNILDKPYNFHADTTASQLVVAFIQFLTWYGNTMIVLISGVLGISPDIFEAADIDGANGVQTFFKITIPNLKTVLLYTLVTSLVGGLNMFDIPQLYNQGGPDNSTRTSSVFIRDLAFSNEFLYNRAAAASMIIFLIIAACSAVLFYIMRDKDEAMRKKEIKAAKRASKLRGGMEW